MPGLNSLASEPFDSGKTYADAVHFVHIYTVEAHPSGTPSPYSGEVWEEQYSVPQPRTYEERVARAKVMEESLGDNQLLLVDSLTPESMNNPVWCTYGPAPNPGFLIDQDGTILVSQQWEDVDEMKTAIDGLLH